MYPNQCTKAGVQRAHRGMATDLRNARRRRPNAGREKSVAVRRRRNPRRHGDETQRHTCITLIIITGIRLRNDTRAFCFHEKRKTLKKVDKARVPNQVSKQTQWARCGRAPSFMVRWVSTWT